MTWERRLKLSWLFARFTKLVCCWRVLRGHQVAYNIKIENGGIVLDQRPCSLVNVTIICPRPPLCPNCGTRVPLETAAITAPLPPNAKLIAN